MKGHEQRDKTSREGDMKEDVSDVHRSYERGRGSQKGPSRKQPEV